MKKLRLTETELIAIINTIINEEEGTEGGGVDSGTSDAGGTGAKTWESGLTRGACKSRWWRCNSLGRLLQY